MSRTDRDHQADPCRGNDHYLDRAYRACAAGRGRGAERIELRKENCRRRSAAGHGFSGGEANLCRPVGVRSAMLETRSLNAHYGDFQALYGVDTVIGRGETIAIIGANGAGKSSYLNAITGLIRTQPGSVVFEDRPIGSIGPANILKLGIAMVPEGRRLFASLTVEENLLIGNYGRNVVGMWSLDSIYALFPVLKKRRAMPSHALSGGEQQM